MADTLDIILHESVAGTNYAYGKGLNHDVPIDIARSLLKAGHASLPASDGEAAKPNKPTENAKSKHAHKAEKR